MSLCILFISCHLSNRVSFPLPSIVFGYFWIVFFYFSSLRKLDNMESSLIIMWWNNVKKLLSNQLWNYLHNTIWKDDNDENKRKWSITEFSLTRNLDNLLPSRKHYHYHFNCCTFWFKKIYTEIIAKEKQQ